MIMDNADDIDSERIDYRNHTENEALQTEPTQDTEDTIMDNQSLSPSESHLIIAEDIGKFSNAKQVQLKTFQTFFFSYKTQF